MRRASAIASGLWILVGLGACDQQRKVIQPPDSAELSTTLVIKAQGDLGAAVTGAELVAARGAGTVIVRPTSLFDGVATVTNGPDDDLPRAVDFPRYARSGTYPVSVIKVAPTSSQALAPSGYDFRFGAVFRINTMSKGRAIDDGDNIFQRGLNSTESMYKLDIANNRAVCVVRGEAGEVMVRSETPIDSETWYRATCTRTANQVSITVALHGGAPGPTRAVTEGATGTLNFPLHLPASIGGKLYESGVIVGVESDQFNGAVALVKYRRL
jgi:hypothetical protein